jgi:diacylglycerol kinase
LINLPGKNYLWSRWQSILTAAKGIKTILVTQKNARIHAIFTLAVILIGFIFQINRLEWVCLLLVVGLVWTAECLNTAIEVVVDIISPEDHPAAKICKDVSAAGVLIAVIISILVGILIFGPPLWRWLSKIMVV